MSEKLDCGHPASLLIKSTESDYQFCELCEARCERDDALHMEESLGVRVRALEDALRRAAKQFRLYEKLHRDKGTDEARAKANSNMIFAQLCERALRPPNPRD